MKVTVTLCDVCGVYGRETRRYTVAEGNRSQGADLCEEDAAALEAVLAGKSTPAPIQPARKAAMARTGPRKRARVVSMAEVEALKH